MEAVTWSEVSYKQPLPKLRMAQESNRRDSLSSSRTGDSGYNSDPDISLSPLDFVGPDQLPYTSSDFTSDSSALLDVKELASNRSKRLPENPCDLLLSKKHKSGPTELLIPKLCITSNPTTSDDALNSQKLNWTSVFKQPVANLDSPPLLEAKSKRAEGAEHCIKDNLHPENRPDERKSSIVSLSSTGSCDMYSNTDDNSEDEDMVDAAPSTLSKAAVKTIELIMRKIEVNLGYAAYMQCAGKQASRAQGGTGNLSRTGRAPQGSGAKRKSRGDSNLPPDDQDDDGSNKRRRVSIATTTEDSESGPRFACPFYKHDPNRYRSRRTCPGPGWPTVHRMKEHLYRSHEQPIFCFRCYAMFDSDNELRNHQRTDPCPISAPQPIDGIDRETVTALHRRTPAGRLEEDKWRDAYQLLFPEVSVADIPSPFYDSDSPTEESRRFRRELLERIRQELFATAEREPGSVEQRLLRQVAGIIQRCESELLSSFHSTSGNLHPSMPVTRRASALSDQVDCAPPAQTSDAVTGRQDTSSFPPPGREDNLSPRTLQGFQALHPPPGTTSSPPSVPWMDNFNFSTDWVDWDAVFPPGSELLTSERGETYPLRSTPVLT